MVWKHEKMLDLEKALDIQNQKENNYRILVETRKDGSRKIKIKKISGPLVQNLLLMI